MAAVDSQMMRVEVAYASEGRSCLLEMTVPKATTVAAAYQQFLSALDKDDADFEWLKHAPLGIFGQKVKDPSSQELQAGDRIEAYAPLKIDPKAARRARAKQ